MVRMNLELMDHVLKGADSQAGLAYLEYYDKHNVYHTGIDLNRGYGNQDLGQPLTSPAKGKVVFVSRRARNGGWGLHLVIRHEELGVYSHWAHLDKAHVKVGDTVNFGSLVASLGNTGTQWAHLHLEVFKNEHHVKMKKSGYKFYPSGYKKSYVSKHYINPENFIKKGVKQSEVKVEPNIVDISLYKATGSPKIYLIGKDGLYHHITTEEVFKAFFGGFSKVWWTDGPPLREDQIGFTIGHN